MPTDADFFAMLKANLQGMIQQSAHGATVHAIPLASRTRELASNREPSFLEHLTPEERFFLFELIPELSQLAGPLLPAEAYCAALPLVPADWWGTPGGADTEAGQHLVALGAAALPCLAAYFDDPRRLVYHQGEANTQAKSFGWTIGDLAAGFAALILAESYDHRASSPEREVRRNELRRRIGTAAP